ncbi:hypothetical protein RRG08_061609 [Elysia crispata]|uniref:Uncharacterized protein n=1 Tax=Elysia crispata TaxID=231223 RepID=A0AAE0YSQ6_9GAST|nr:hypothetical protein RRG08_061609 [Elysia crispata]
MSRSKTRPSVIVQFTEKLTVTNRKFNGHVERTTRSLCCQATNTNSASHKDKRVGPVWEKLDGEAKQDLQNLEQTILRIQLLDQDIRQQLEVVQILRLLALPHSLHLLCGWGMRGLQTWLSD